MLRMKSSFLAVIIAVMPQLECDILCAVIFCLSSSNHPTCVFSSRARRSFIKRRWPYIITSSTVPYGAHWDSEIVVKSQHSSRIKKNRETSTVNRTLILATVSETFACHHATPRHECVDTHRLSACHSNCGYDEKQLYAISATSLNTKR